MATTFKHVRDGLNNIGEIMKEEDLLDRVNHRFTWLIFNNIIIDTYSPESDYGYPVFQIRLKLGEWPSIEKPITKVQIRDDVNLYPIRNGCKMFESDCMGLDINMRIDTEEFKEFCNTHFYPFGDIIYNTLNAIGYDMDYEDDEEEEE